MSRKQPKVVKTESELQKLIEDTRKLRKEVKPAYNPTSAVILNGTEIANYETSGFPKYQYIKQIVEKLIPRYRILICVVDTSLRYLLNEKETSEYEQALHEGIRIKNTVVPIQEVGTYEDIVLTLLKLALKHNAKIVSNEDLKQSYELIKSQKLKNFGNKKFQVHYTITEDEITLFES